MGQTWAVVAIGVSIGIALLLLYWSRQLSAPPAKAAPKPAPKAAKEESREQGAPEPSPAPSKTDAAQASKTPAPAKSEAAAAKKDATAAKKDAAPAPSKSGTAEKPAADAGPSSVRARAPTIPEPAVQRRSVPQVPSVAGPDDEDDDITIVTLTPRADLMAAAAGLPDASSNDDDDQDDDEGNGPDSGRAAAVPIIYDAEAAEDEPTRAHAVILVAAVGQTDQGKKRKINEDRYLALDEHNLYVVADGMGGHAGGEVASQLAVDVIAQAFTEQKFEGEPYENVPRRGSELALAIQMANRAIHERAKREPKLTGMGTTIVSARFTPGKERVYIGHVGDSRCYRFRAGQLTQITTDHTMGAIGMTGPFADHLSRAVGIAPAVKVDLVIAKPRHEDVFLLCSDGLSKMVKDDGLRDILAAHQDPNEAVQALVQRANERGGRDNITVILVVVKDPTGFVKYVTAQKKKRAEAEAAEAAGAGAAAEAGPSPATEAEASDGAAAAKEVTPSAPEAKTSVPSAPEAKTSVPSSPEAKKTSVPPPRPSVPPRPSSPGKTSVPPPRPSSPEAVPPKDSKG